MLQGGFNHLPDILVVASALPDPFRAFFQREDLPIGVRQVQVVDICREGQRHEVRISLLFLTEAAAGISHIPLVSLVCDIQVRNRAPAHAAFDRVALVHHRADRFQVGCVQIAVPGRPDDRALGSSAAHAKGKDAVHIPGKQFPVIPGVADRRLEIGHAGRRTFVPAPGSRKDHDDPGGGIVRNGAISHGAVISRRRVHGGITRSVDGKDQRRG